MKLTIRLLLIFLLLIGLVGCNKDEEVIQDESPITMFVSLGNGQKYHEQLRDLIYEDLGIEVRLIYKSTGDTTNYARQQFANNDLCADIMITASATDDSLLENSCLDLMSYTHLIDLFTYEKSTTYTTDKGQLFQLPFTSRLIGITYNKTLMDELGFSVPNTYEELFALKKKCDELGVKFAVSGGVATGHGFNYLLHTVGAEWISTLEGSEWLTSYLKGEVGIEPLKEHSTCFKELVESGIFGSFHDQDWSASYEFATTRALFLFDITNSIYSYEGPLYDDKGEPTETILHDEYASMPWLSVNGSSNCFTYYDNFFLYVNKKLEGANQKDRLNKVVQILEYMTTDKVTSLFSDNFKDGYVAVKDYNIDESRLYYKYKNEVEQGYIQPWFYNYFDSNTIVNTGAVVNAYIKDGSKSFDEIFEVFNENYQNYLHNEVAVLTTFASSLTYQDTAKLSIIAGLNSIKNKTKITPDFGLLPYIENDEDLYPYSKVAVQSSKAFKGDFIESHIKTLISSNNITAIYMSGKELNEIISTGYIDVDRVYQYELMGKEKIDEDKTYLVSLPHKAISEEKYDYFLANNKVLTVDGAVFETTIEQELINYLMSHNNIEAGNITLE